MVKQVFPAFFFSLFPPLFAKAPCISFHRNRTWLQTCFSFAVIAVHRLRQERYGFISFCNGKYPGGIWVCSC